MVLIIENNFYLGNALKDLLLEIRMQTHGFRCDLTCLINSDPLMPGREWLHTMALT